MSKTTPIRWWRDDATRYQSKPPIIEAELPFIERRQRFFARFAIATGVLPPEVLCEMSYASMATSEYLSRLAEQIKP